MDGGFSFQRSTQLGKLIEEVTHVTQALDPACHRQAVASLLRLALPHVNVIPSPDAAICDGGYARDLIHVDPAGRFSVLVLSWAPDAATPVHGHNAWGCVGVMDGEIGCETYDCDSDCLSNGSVASSGRLLAGPGAVASVEPAPEGVHRLFNPTRAGATTLHIYGMDLSDDPCCINIPVAG